VIIVEWGKNNQERERRLAVSISTEKDVPRSGQDVCDVLFVDGARLCGILYPPQGHSINYQLWFWLKYDPFVVWGLFVLGGGALKMCVSKYSACMEMQRKERLTRHR